VEVAMQMLWLGSKDASFVNGEVVVLDGGMGVTSSNYQQYVYYAEEADRIIQNQD
jgi:hypothetical protein